MANIKVALPHDQPGCYAYTRTNPTTMHVLRRHSRLENTAAVCTEHLMCESTAQHISAGICDEYRALLHALFDGNAH